VPIRYFVVSLLDKNDNELGLFSLKTNIGELVVLFSDLDALTKYLQVARDQSFVKPSAKTRRIAKFGRREVEGAGLEEIRNAIVSTNPSLMSATFITDEDDTFDDLMEGLDLTGSDAPREAAENDDPKIPEGTFQVIVNLDSQMRPTGLTSFATSHGPIVVLYRNPRKCTQALNALSLAKLQEPDENRRATGLLALEANSFEEAVADMRSKDATLVGTVTFIADDDQIFDSLLESFIDSIGS
jgi:hypothetical protein